MALETPEQHMARTEREKREKEREKVERQKRESAAAAEAVDEAIRKEVPRAAQVPAS